MDLIALQNERDHILYKMASLRESEDTGFKSTREGLELQERLDLVQNRIDELIDRCLEPEEDYTSFSGKLHNGNLVEWEEGQEIPSRFRTGIYKICVIFLKEKADEVS